MFKLGINVKSPVSHNTTLTAVQLAQIKADLEPLLEDGNVSNMPAADKWALLEDLAYDASSLRQMETCQNTAICE